MKTVKTTRSSSRIKWTHDMRLFMYNLLVLEFGPLSNWPKTRKGEGKTAIPEDKERFQELLQKLKRFFSDHFQVDFSEDAIEQQIKFTTSVQEEFQQAHVRTYLLNAAAAIEAGFLSFSDLPKCILRDY